MFKSLVGDSVHLWMALSVSNLKKSPPNWVCLFEGTLFGVDLKGNQQENRCHWGGGPFKNKYSVGSKLNSWGKSHVVFVLIQVPFGVPVFEPQSFDTRVLVEHKSNLLSDFQEGVYPSLAESMAQNKSKLYIYH